MKPNKNETIEIRFEGLDSFHRPIFKSENGVRYGDVNGTNMTEVVSIIHYYKTHPDKLTLFGTSFDCEPDGSKPYYKLKIVDKL